MPGVFLKGVLEVGRGFDSPVLIGLGRRVRSGLAMRGPGTWRLECCGSDGRGEVESRMVGGRDKRDDRGNDVASISTNITRFDGLGRRGRSATDLSNSERLNSDFSLASVQDHLVVPRVNDVVESWSPENLINIAAVDKARSYVTPVDILQGSVAPRLPTAGNFVEKLVDEFQRVAEEEIQNCYRRIQVTPGFHTFVLQGTANLVQLPMFNVEISHQLIIKVTIAEKDLETWNEHQKRHPSHNQGGFGGVITIASPYPAQMPFYIYGSLAQTHLDHMLLLIEGGLRKGLIAVASAKPEFAMQPFTDAHLPTLFVLWSDGIALPCTDDCDRNEPGLVGHLGRRMATATIGLGSNVFADWCHLNSDAALELDGNAAETQFAGSITLSRFLVRPPAHELGRK
ncbi:hypothetical protein C8F04DRAFT_1192305 [Mycena alexandri]|uniref:Uncharacterized protein n=1 Tax=Mycena alexandri TaxID=1745969 RepID=A0AAD6SEC4_9AGAR|nr:hypothetical protein C8F04DRAFT_1192305 [Mycena alexandri]